MYINIIVSRIGTQERKEVFVWRFFKGRVPFRRFVNILFRRRIIETAVFAVIELLKEKDILDDKGPPPDKIYEELIEKFGYIVGVILQHGC